MIGRGGACAAACVIAVATMAGVAWGDDEDAAIDDIGGATELYGADDGNLQEKLQLEKYLGLYMVKPPRRHVAEIVELYRNRATVRYWYSLGPDADQVACDGLRWMLFGRHQWAGGVQRIFEETEVTEVNLHFIHVPKAVKGKRPGPKDYRRFVELRLSRRKVEDLPVADARHAVDSGAGCGTFMKKHFDRYRFDSRFYRRELKRHSRK